MQIDRNTLEGCITGNPNAQQKLFSLITPLIHRYLASRISHDRSVIEDITSLTVMRIFSSLHTFDISRMQSWNAWVFRIAYTQLLDRYKKKQDEHPDIDRETIPESDRPDHIQKANTDTLFSEISSYLESCDPSIKEIVYARVWENLSFAEIGDRIGKSSDACKQTFYRTIKDCGGRFSHLL